MTPRPVKECASKRLLKPWTLPAMPLQSGVTSPGVAALWARHKVEDLLDGLHRGDHAGEVKDAVIETALTHRLVTSYTSLVAVDVAPVRPPEADWQRGDVVTNLPHGWSYELAREFEPCAATIHGWVKQADRDGGQRKS